jgi:hypothetical protein
MKALTTLYNKKHGGIGARASPRRIMGLSPTAWRRTRREGKNGDRRDALSDVTTHPVTYSLTPQFLVWYKIVDHN